MMIRKTIILVSALLFSGIISGQTSFESILKAKSLLMAGEPAKSVEELSSAITRKKDGRLYIARAEAFMHEGNHEMALNDYTVANSLISHSGDYGLARIYALKGDAKTSLCYLEMNFLSSFRKSEKEVMLDAAFSRIEKSPEWRQFWRRDWYSVLETGVSEIEYYLSTGRTRSAVEKLSELEGSYKGNEELQYAGALVNLSTGKPAEAVKILAGMSALQSGNEKYLRLLAKAQTEANNPSGASITYSRLLDIEVPDASLLLLRAGCYRKTDENARAMSDIERYISLYPRDKSALSLAGKIRSAQGDNLKALDYFSENLKYHPGDASCFVDRANTYFLLKSWESAINDYGMSLDLDPSNPEAWLNKGIARLNSGKTSDACHDFRYALKLGNKKAADYISRHCIK